MDQFERLRDDVKRGDVVAIRKFLTQGGDPGVHNRWGETLLSVAAAVGQTPIVELLLAAGVNVNSGDQHGHTPLLFASIYGHERTVRLLLARGADPSIPASGWSIVGWLEHYGAARQRIVDLLTSSAPGKI